MTRGLDPARETDTVSFDRRRLLQFGASAGLVGVAGCLDEFDSGSDDEGDGNGADDENTGSSEDGPNGESNEDDTTDDGPDGDPETVAEAFAEAAVAGDDEELSTLAHSSSPLNPAAYEDDEDTELTLGMPPYDSFHVEDVTEGLSTDDLLEHDGPSLYFDVEELEEIIDDESTALVETTVELADGVGSAEPMGWLLVSEDDEWRFFLFSEMGDTEPDPPEIPDETLEADVVEEVIFDTEADVPMARVVFTESPDVDTVTAVTTSGVGELSVDSPERTNYVQLGYDPDGDEVVVIATDGDRAGVVYREAFEPGAE